jgi:hypothetical protein
MRLHRNGIDRAVQGTKFTGNTDFFRSKDRVSFGIRCIRGVLQGNTSNRTYIDANFTRHAFVRLNIRLGPIFPETDSITKPFIMIQDGCLGTNFTTGTAIDAPFHINFVVFTPFALNAVNRADLLTQTAPNAFIRDGVCHFLIRILGTVSKLPFSPISALGARFQSSKYLSIPPVETSRPP